MGNDKSPFLTLSTASKYASLTLLSDRGCGSNVTHQQERRTSKQRLKQGWMDCPPVSPGGGSEVPEALLEPGVGAGLTGSPW